MDARVIFVVALFATMACGDRGGGSGPPGLPHGGGGTGASAGASGASGSGGTLETGGAAGAPSGGSGGCAGYHVTGTLDGQTVDTVFVTGPAVDSGYAGTEWRDNVLFEHGAIVSLEGSAGAPPTAGMVLTGTGYLAAPPGSALAGVHLVSKAASTGYQDSKQPTLLDSLSRVGSCPGTPVTGSISVCAASSFASGSPCGAQKLRVQGNLDGVAIDESGSIAGSFYIAALGVEVGRIDLDTDGKLWVHDKGGNLQGFLIMPTSFAQPGVVLCLDGVTLTHTSDKLEVSATSISKAGTLPGDAVSGTLKLERCP